jgi:hypothetical protein
MGNTVSARPIAIHHDPRTDRVDVAVRHSVRSRAVGPELLQPK